MLKAETHPSEQLVFLTYLFSFESGITESELELIRGMLKAETEPTKQLQLLSYLSSSEGGITESELELIRGMLKAETEPTKLLQPLLYLSSFQDGITESEEKLLARYSQRSIPGGVEVLLDSFLGGEGPAEYSYQCEPRRAIWIRAKNSNTPEMRANFYLEKTPSGAARLVLEAQDDDKPGAVRVEISVNDKAVFSGPNQFKEKGWSRAEFPLPMGTLRQGKNEIRFTNLEPVGAADLKWFMVSECKVLFE
jgi:hypothetical protein